MIPAMLLHRPRGSGSFGRNELVRRTDDFAQGKWQALIESARRAACAETRQKKGTGEVVQRRIELTEAKSPVHAKN